MQNLGLCPICSKNLVVSQVSGKNVKQCPSCKGTWFKKQELDKLLSSIEKKNDGDCFISSTSVINRQIEEQYTQVRVYCPNCKTAMSKESFNQFSHVIVDKCTNCEAYWLDSGEIEHLIKETAGTTILDYNRAKQFIEEELKHYCSKSRDHDVGRFENYCMTCGAPVINKNLARINKIEGITEYKNKDEFPIKIEPNTTFDYSERLGFYRTDESFENITIHENNGVLWVGFGVGIYCIWDILFFDKGPRRSIKTPHLQGEFPIRAKMLGNWIVIWSNKKILVEDIRAVMSSFNDAEFAYFKEIGDKSQISPNPLVVEIKKTNNGTPGVKICWLEIDNDGNCHIFSVSLDSFEKFDLIKSEKLFVLKDLEKSWPYLLPVTTDLSKMLVIGERDIYLLEMNKDGFRPKCINGILDDTKVFNLRLYDQDCGGVVLHKSTNDFEFHCALELSNTLGGGKCTKIFTIKLTPDNINTQIKAIYEGEKCLGLHFCQGAVMFCTTDYENIILRNPITGSSIKNNYSNLLSDFFLIKSIGPILSIFKRSGRIINRYDCYNDMKDTKKYEHEKYLDLTCPDNLAKLNIYEGKLILNGLILPHDLSVS